LPTNSSNGYAHRGFPRRCPLKRWTQIPKPIFGSTGKICLARTRFNHSGDLFAFPFYMICIFNQEGNRRSVRFSSHHAAQQPGGILFNFHPFSRSKAALPACKLGIDHGLVQG
jgi:hypothetical protein